MIICFVVAIPKSLPKSSAVVTFGLEGIRFSIYALNYPFNGKGSKILHIGMRKLGFFNVYSHFVIMVCIFFVFL